MKLLYASDSDDDFLDVEHDSYEEGPLSPTCDDSDKNDGHEILPNNLCDNSVPVEKIVLYNNALLNFWRIISWNCC